MKRFLGCWRRAPTYWSHRRRRWDSAEKWYFLGSHAVVLAGTTEMWFVWGHNSRHLFWFVDEDGDDQSACVEFVERLSPEEFNLHFRSSYLAKIYIAGVLAAQMGCYTPGGTVFP